MKIEEYIQYFEKNNNPCRRHRHSSTVSHIHQMICSSLDIYYYYYTSKTSSPSPSSHFYVPPNYNSPLSTKFYPNYCVNVSPRLFYHNDFWIHPGFILDLSWIYPGFILDSSWIHPGFILDLSWVHPGFILDSSWIHPGLFRL